MNLPDEPFRWSHFRGCGRPSEYDRARGFVGWLRVYIAGLSRALDSWLQ